MSASCALRASSICKISLQELTLSIPWARRQVQSDFFSIERL